jgi:hypothetical protein
MPQLEGIESIIASLDWASDLSNRVVIVLVGYFDDSGTHASSPIAIMAGYVADADAWGKFERKTKRLFERERIPFFRAKLFDHGEDHFSGWSLPRKLRFATEWYGYAQDHILRGVSAGALKADLAAVKKKERKFPAVSAPAYCMQIALTHLCADPEVWSAIREGGLSIIIESSTSIDSGIAQDINRVIAVNQINEHLHSVTFAKKTSARALQLGDYLAYYSHRFGVALNKDKAASIPEFLEIARANVQTINKLAHSFEPNPEYFAALSSLKRKKKQLS